MLGQKEIPFSWQMPPKCLTPRRVKGCLVFLLWFFFFNYFGWSLLYHFISHTLVLFSLDICVDVVVVVSFI